jgi:hypothetical protein
MARMLPSQFDSSTVSTAERKLFDLIKNDPGTETYIVLHSLGLAKRAKKPYGEIDFVVMIPGFGVFCIEVKGGRLACEDGEWTTTNRRGETDKLKRSPFMQAREGMFEIRDAVLNRAPVGFPSSVVFGYAVAFPDISFSVQSPEWQQWQVIDRESLRQPISISLRRLAQEHRRAYSIPSRVKEPTNETIRIVQKMLRPDFEIVVTRGAQIEDTEEQLLRLTEEQYDGLDTLEANERCLAEGAAGTGKTMLALEFARHSALAGRRTLLLCFNQLLGDWFGRRVAEFGLADRLIAGRHYQLLRRAILDSTVSAEFQEDESRSNRSDLFNEVFPLYGVEALERLGERFDQLVVDEAQDLLTGGVLAVWDAWVEGGLKSGRWAVFGDFHKQAIFQGSASGNELRQRLTAEAGSFARVPLNQNCRNTVNIGEETSLLSGFSSLPYRMGQVVGLPVDYRYYNSTKGQCEALAMTLRRLLAEGIKAHDIVVISAKRLSNSGVASVQGEDHFCLAGIGDASPSKARVPVIRFATAQAFKGMESPVVVLCDVDAVNESQSQALLYVAMSRARSHLTVLVHEQTKPAIRERLRRKLQEEAKR